MNLPQHAHRSSKTWRPGAPDVVWAIALGALSGFVAALLRLVFRGVQWLFTQSWGTLPQAAAGLLPWRRFLVPVAGALVATAVLAWQRWNASRKSRKLEPYSDYVSAIRLEHGRIPLPPNLWRTGSSTFSVSTGAAIGREGSMIQFAAAITSAAARRVRQRWPKLQRVQRFPAPLGVACGVAGGVATAYQAPVAAIFFAAEIGIGGLHPAGLLLLALASCSGWLVSRAILGHGPLYPLHPALTMTAYELAMLALLAVCMGAVGPLYQLILRSLTAMRKLPGALVWGGVAVGALSLLDPRVWGNGDAGLDAALGRAAVAIHGGVPMLKALLVLLLLRLLATTICVGVGTVGGVFTPTLFAGGALGLLAGSLLHAHDPVVFAVVGMGCLVAAATHAPLMAACMAVELTGDWRLLPFTLIACAISWIVARQISSRSIYAIASENPVHQGLAPAAQPGGEG